MLSNIYGVVSMITNAIAPL